jgi:Eukaryotic protein of unknown function (DUF829)
MTYIPTPAMVVKAVLQAPLATNQSVKLTCSPTWPHKIYSSPTDMQQAAWNVLAQLAHTTEPLVVWHVFSNAGCFLWEQVRLIIRQAESTNQANAGEASTIEQQGYKGNTQSADRGQYNLPEPVTKRLADLRARFAGLVVDSAPGQELHHVDKAMDYCSLSERLQTSWDIGSDWMFYRKTPDQIQRIKLRQDEYWSRLRDDEWKLPQLYLYSKDDPLIGYATLNGLVNHRQEVIGKDRVWKRTWESSPHCGHLLAHPQEYEQAVTEFANYVTMQEKETSRL